MLEFPACFGLPSSRRVSEQRGVDNIEGDLELGSEVTLEVL
jgi:hypothetical protein